jgi:hypothetical protein
VLQDTFNLKLGLLSRGCLLCPQSADLVMASSILLDLVKVEFELAVAVHDQAINEQAH